MNVHLTQRQQGRERLGVSVLLSVGERALQPRQRLNQSRTRATQIEADATSTGKWTTVRDAKAERFTARRRISVTSTTAVDPRQIRRLRCVPAQRWQACQCRGQQITIAL